MPTGQIRHRIGARLLGERGAAAVEFALVVPLLVLLMVGIIDVSKALNAEATLSSAAREAARTMALTSDQGQARAAALLADGALDLAAGNITITPATCAGAPAGATVTVRITYRQVFASGLVGQAAGVDLTGTAVMRCGG